MKNELSIAKAMIQAAESPWQMIQMGLIYTLDETDLKNPVKLFPESEWIKYVIDEWMEHKLLAIPKSRRMLMTWTMALCHLWLAMFHEGANVFLVSDKEEKSDHLVKRCEFIFNHIPSGSILLPKMRSKFCLMEFPGLNSAIHGVPQGAGQLRQFTATALFFDEFAFWERGAETLSASKPTIEGGGRLTIVSSAQEGAFQDVVFDTIN